MTVSYVGAVKSAKQFVGQIKALKEQRDKHPFDSTNYISFDDKMVALERQAVTNAMDLWRPLAASILYLMLDAPESLNRNL